MLYQDPDDRGVQWWSESAENIADIEAQIDEKMRADAFAEAIFDIGVEMMRSNVQGQRGDGGFIAGDSAAP